MTKISYSGYRFPPEIIQQAIWLYVRFTLSFRDVEPDPCQRPRLGLWPGIGPRLGEGEGGGGEGEGGVRGAR
jgi:hypothetical protein